MSDGAMSFIISKNRKGVDPGFMNPVTKYLNDAEPEMGSKALAETLSSTKTDSITGDDKSLIWAFRKQNQSKQTT